MQFKHDWTKLTKRIILSSVSQIYDPLGLLSPSIMTVKVLLQKLWLLKLGWDDPVPEDVVCIWNRFASNLSVLSSLRVPRYVTCDDPIHTELHIFTDASQTAYGACAYIRTITADGNVCVRLLFAKGKVTPLKPVTIPRLELCGALLGAKLFHKDLQPLSPAHFLVGRPLTSSLSANLEETPVHRLTRYQRIEQIKQNFWRRWSKEYVSELQTRMKWRTQTQDLKEGTLVIIKDDNSPPLKWQLGRVTSNIPGRDGIARVACIQTTTGVIKRAYAKICPLPLTTADTS
ncbi:uncharacterized protein LOC126381551 [Pectinophora gossypiella]|uniref:uncharacterized protein LOC126381551 n=1 Tax=Pectinophora gossypiella TaxID=13191 RepID=UPI00214F09BC|nr:uncharacterized protein LOC126381551 [Pectinophora gossypiella]